MTLSTYFTQLRKSEKKALILYLTAGFPDLKSTERLCYECRDLGVDCIELGIPFSDPIADGPIIQHSSQQALSSGVTLSQIFDLTSRLTSRLGIPLLFMGYYNPFYQRGFSTFAQECASSGVSGLIIPDLPFEESKPLKKFLNPYNIPLISLLTSSTSIPRMKRIAKSSKGFIYFISSSGVTGARQALPERLKEDILLVKTLTTTPVAVGFGISTPSQVESLAEFADGIIIGSAAIQLLSTNSFTELHKLLRSFRSALDCS
ncbi:MAG: tryptophan synthase subunit alpha [Candidatus Ratteibacteria bacterium]|jgi:tryptophan synthase alpha chain